MKKVLILVTRSPYGSSLNAEAFRAAIGMAFSEIDVSVVLVGDGTCSARKGQEPEGIQMRSLGTAYARIGDFQAKLSLYHPSVEERRFRTEDLIDAPWIGPEELRDMIAGSDAVLTF
jgi:sulfur relay (sulfurtransferase) DsrF/TusC family protein